ncbi:Hsp20/alpha crystallin family protein [Bdellovibrio svalbardensis]|uniref:Hsp20/alpha crystallin family protein n=1 Tax=Bdellovibrio svalbardensis TaxID=2972972 RepID=A0ABT6DMQ8_9BACT|nr:Hsp20/alpha crystallin family protein [Bdellovibrio svalbardensis]MDG0818153.1 Hsp20/alpha crystallin family protein [Bdellovibrio svalbardensis]
MANIPDLFRSNRFASPFREIARMQQDMDRIMNELVGTSEKSLSQFSFSPTCEVSEQENSYQMKFDLPGVKKEQVKVEVDGSQLTIRAERKEEKEEKTKKKHLSEISYGEYVRSFTLPQPIDEKKVDAKFEDGVLLVTVPKTEASKARQISIH